MREIIEYKRKNEVLFILYAANKILREPLSRIEVQKSVYLCNVLAPIKELILDFFEFRVWNHGPYSSEIQNTLNNLVALRYIRMNDYNVRTNNNVKYESSYYSILDKGILVVEKLIEYPDEKEQYLWIQSIIKIIGIYGIKNIVKIVYEEPTFRFLKQNENNRGQAIPINNVCQNKIIDLFKMIKDIAVNEFRYMVETPENVLLAVFDFLYSSIYDDIKDEEGDYINE